MKRSWSINMTGPSDRWIMHGQRSNQCMGRLIGLTRPTAIVINKEARIQCFYRMSVVNCSQLYKSRWTIAKFNFIEIFKKNQTFNDKEKGIQIESPARWTDFKFWLTILWDKIHAFSFHKCLNWTRNDHLMQSQRTRIKWFRESQSVVQNNIIE